MPKNLNLSKFYQSNSYLWKCFHSIFYRYVDCFSAVNHHKTSQYKVSQIKAEIISMENCLWKAENLKKKLGAWNQDNNNLLLYSFSSRNGIQTGDVCNCSQCQRFSSLPEIIHVIINQAYKFLFLGIYWSLRVLTFFEK